MRILVPKLRFGSFCETTGGFNFLYGCFFVTKSGFKEYFSRLVVFFSKFHGSKIAGVWPKFTSHVQVWAPLWEKKIANILKLRS